MTDSARAVINAIAEKWSVPGGVVVAVDLRGETFLHRFGFADLERGEPVEPQHLFQIGSISKVLTSMAVLQLVEQNMFTLDTPVGAILGWLPAAMRAPDITIRRLLNHTGGLVASVDAVPDEIGQATLHSGPPSLAAVGKIFHYSNFGYILLGLVVAHVSGTPLPEVVAQRILQPLGMQDTIACVRHEDYPLLARGYQPLHDDRPWVPGDPLIPAPWMEVAGADGNLACTASDLGRFARMLLGRGVLDGTRVLYESTFEAMVSALAPTGEDVLDLPGLAPGQSSRYGLGINVERADNSTLLTHGGGMVGYASFLLVDLDGGTAVCVVTNANGDTPVAEAIARCVAAELSAPGAVPIDRLDPGAWDADDVQRLGYLGEFVSATASSPGESVRVAATEQSSGVVRLSVSAGGQQAPLLRTWGRRAVTRMPALRRYALVFDANRWIWGPEDLNPIDAPRDSPAGAPTTGSEFCGHYRSYSPWFTNFRVVQRRGALVLIAPGGVEAPSEDVELVQVGPATFRIGLDETLPERITFGPLVNGVSAWADRDGCRYSRAFTD
ncbi:MULTISPECIES: serine hydrolase domain-containing protein [Mycobacteriaceae]|uniref:Beta-lactamase-related domain-containing protein n=1 Tax=Mycolicibacterium neoaurum VKM Ac-1815D TaxID=700508 RepID=V5XIE3_MYCNE|nr:MULTISPECIES: serine hydrolase domain-containing protein [Mycobacteriaceae]AHC27792.1 hypothetical protein D174_02510 [Mycolicibacterium neoaurum VKM Ac-1815D]AMO04231.1 hypothetical protein MyAD_02445 [Mycolicibacterium neoaurum]AXK77486.1 class A beta-lactamase-related serine hydrolase [Mycolicibacterium neoaurum]KJQ48675.1 hypothetical protein TS71_20175 [Mycolicibacterium neoaurum]KUM08720.1 hypothetical protein AVZ31_10170 [Mycolicibacterium neoaurum]